MPSGADIAELVLEGGSGLALQEVADFQDYGFGYAMRANGRLVAGFRRRSGEQCLFGDQEIGSALVANPFFPNPWPAF